MQSASNKWSIIDPMLHSVFINNSNCLTFKLFFSSVFHPKIFGHMQSYGSHHIFYVEDRLMDVSKLLILMMYMYALIKFEKSFDDDL